MVDIDKALINRLRSAIEKNLPKELLLEEKEKKASNDVVLFYGRSDVYDSKFKTLLGLFSKNTGLPEPKLRHEFITFARWVVDSHRLTLSAASWNLYKSCIKAILVDDEIKRIVSVKSANGKKDIVKRSSAKRVKSMPDDVLMKIMRYFKASESKYADVTMRLLFVIRKLGIRPAEIMTCEIITYKGFRFFKVRSLKKENHHYQDTGISSEYEYRYVPMLHINTDEIPYIETTLRSFNQIASKEIFDSLYESIRQCFHRACKNLNLNDIHSGFSLYSARQQFSADLKATPLSTKLRSLIMSHNEEGTLRHHYAKTSLGKAMFKPDASFEAIIMECFDKQV